MKAFWIKGPRGGYIQFENGAVYDDVAGGVGRGSLPGGGKMDDLSFEEAVEYALAHCERVLTAPWTSVAPQGLRAYVGLERGEVMCCPWCTDTEMRYTPGPDVATVDGPGKSRGIGCVGCGRSFFWVEGWPSENDKAPKIDLTHIVVGEGEVWPIKWHCQECGKACLKTTGMPFLTSWDPPMAIEHNTRCLAGYSMSMQPFCSICDQDLDWGDDLCAHQKVES